MDTCITIRTLLMQGDKIFIQAGAGIVADSDPTSEYHETLNKARALRITSYNVCYTKLLRTSIVLRSRPRGVATCPLIVTRLARSSSRSR